MRRFSKTIREDDCAGFETIEDLQEAAAQKEEEDELDAVSDLDSDEGLCCHLYGFKSLGKINLKFFRCSSAQKQR